MNKTNTPGPTQQNIETVARLEQRFLEQRTTVDRIGDLIGTFAGSMSFVLLHVVIFTLWFLINTTGIAGIPKFDPFPFILLSMAVSVEAVLLSTFVLMKQNNMNRRADRRNELNLQIDLLAEKEITTALQMLAGICEHLGVNYAGRGAEVEELSQNTAVEELAEELHAKMPRE